MLFQSLNKKSLFIALLIAGVALWAGGICAAVVGQSQVGAILRTIALILVASGCVFRHSSLIVWTVVATLVGAEIGVDAPHLAEQTKIAVDLFLRLIRTIVAPLIFATITTGIAQQSHLKSVGRVAVKALVLFEIFTVLGMVFGSVAMGFSGLGYRVAIPASANQLLPVAQVHTWQQAILNLFPENIVLSISQNNILQVVFFSLMFGVAMAMLPQEKRAPLLSVLQSLADAIFQLTRLIICLAPLATGAAIAYAVASCGLASLLPLAKLVLVCYATFATYMLLVLLPILLTCRIPIRRFIAAIAEPAAIGFATSSSEAALPLAMECIEEYGVPRSIVSFVVPTGYSFNLIGSSIYLSIAAIFTAQAAGVHLSLMQLVTILLTLMLASWGVAGVPRAVLVVLLATASSIHLPTAPIMLLLGIDALVDMGRTMLNVVGNCVAATVVAHSEGELIC